MTRKASMFVLVAIAGLTFVASASAQTLSVGVASKLAAQLARKQVRSRHLVIDQITPPRRRSSREIVFGYADRSRAHVVCTALIDVRGPSGPRNTVTARFVDQRCHGIPADALQVEAATLSAVASVTARHSAIERELAIFARQLKPCARLRLPRGMRARAAALVALESVEAIETPVDRVLGDFALRLQSIHTYHAALTAGTAAWADYVDVLRSLPRVSNACAALRQWARVGYAPNAAPVDFRAVAALNRRSAGDSVAIARAARLLAREGVFTRAVAGYTPKGLLLALQPKLTVP